VIALIAMFIGYGIGVTAADRLHSRWKGYSIGAVAGLGIAIGLGLLILPRQ
jgi:hypothetical protein